MKVVPTSGPVIQAPGESQAQQSAKARAIEAFTKGSPAELNSAPSQTPKTSYPPNQRPPLSVAGHPVQDPNNISPEEVSAIHSEVTTQETSIEETAPAEPPKEATKTPEEEQISSQYAQLARQSKAFRAQVAAEKNALKAREDAVKAKEAEMHSNYVPKERITKDTLRVLQEQGLTPEQITNMVLNQPDPVQQQYENKIAALEQKLSALEEGQNATKKSFEDQQRASYTQAVNMIRNEATSMVESDAAFETIKATNSVEEVVDLITKTYDKEGRMLTVEEAANAVEEYLVEEALKIARLGKIQQRLKPATPAKSTASEPKTATKTLTSAMNTSRPLTAKERAILAFKGELKS